MLLRLRLIYPLIATILLVPSTTCFGVIIYGGGGDGSGQNTSAPTGYFANSGWQFEGNWQVGVGTPIAPNLFITAAHLGGSVGDSFTYQGQNYTTTAAYNDPGTDVTIWKVQQQFNSYAPIYQGNVDPSVTNGNALVTDFGRGLTRGSEITGPTGNVQGYNFGNYTGNMSWGVNAVAGTLQVQGLSGNFLGFFFANTTTPGYFNQFVDPINGQVQTASTLSSGDSGGGVFVQRSDGTWALAGINYGVDGAFSNTPNGSGGYTNFFGASLFDKRGYYDQATGTYYPTTDAQADPGLWVASELYDKLDFINGTIAANPVPEPGSIALMGLGIGFVLTMRRVKAARRRSTRS